MTDLGNREVGGVSFSAVRMKLSEDIQQSTIDTKLFALSDEKEKIETKGFV
jgi:hypothetical protein